MGYGDRCMFCDIKIVGETAGECTLRRRAHEVECRRTMEQRIADEDERNILKRTAVQLRDALREVVKQFNAMDRDMNELGCDYEFGLAFVANKIAAPLLASPAVQALPETEEIAK